VTNEAATNDELKILHKTIKKVEDDIEKLSYNTSVSAFMICVNELTDLKCHKAEVLKDLLLILSPFAPFTTEFLWQELLVKTPTTAVGESIVTSEFPKVREELLVENSFEYPIAINGKTKTKITFALDKEILEIEKEVIATEAIQKFLEGKQPKKVIIVKGKMINVVV
jgi:leucyl-tRNA synthetase